MRFFNPAIPDLIPISEPRVAIIVLQIWLRLSVQMHVPYNMYTVFKGIDVFCGYNMTLLRILVIYSTTCSGGNLTRGKPECYVQYWSISNKNITPQVCTLLIILDLYVFSKYMSYATQAATEDANSLEYSLKTVHLIHCLQGVTLFSQWQGWRDVCSKIFTNT